MIPGIDSPHPLLSVLIGYLLLAGLVIDVIVLFRLPLHLQRLRRNVAFLAARPWTGDRGGVFLAMVAAAAFMAQTAVGWLARTERIPTEQLERIGLLYCPLVIHLALLVTLAVLLQRYRWTLSQAFGIDRRRLARVTGIGLIAFVGMLPPLLAANLGYLTLLGRFGFQTEPQQVIGLLTDPGQPTWTYVVLASMAVVVAPIGEEICFRGIALPLLVRRFPIGFSVCLTSAVFALLHLHVPSVMAMFLLGAGFAAAYIYAASIVTPILMHALFNLLNIAAVCALS